MKRSSEESSPDEFGEEAPSSRIFEEASIRRIFESKDGKETTSRRSLKKIIMEESLEILDIKFHVKKK